MGIIEVSALKQGTKPDKVGFAQSIQTCRDF